MPRSSSPTAVARRALIADIKDDKKGWLRHGIAALAISVLGLGVAGSVALTGAAQDATTADPAANTEISRAREASTSRESDRAALDAAKLESLADQRAEELNKSESTVDRGSQREGGQSAPEAARVSLRRRSARGRPDRLGPGHLRRQRNLGCRDRSEPALLRRQELPARRPWLQHRRPFRPGRHLVALPHRLRLLRTGRHPAARIRRRRGDQRRHRAGQRLGRQLRRDQARRRHPDSMLAHMSTVSVRVGQTVAPARTSARSA